MKSDLGWESDILEFRVCFHQSLVRQSQEGITLLYLNKISFILYKIGILLSSKHVGAGYAMTLVQCLASRQSSKTKTNTVTTDINVKYILTVIF